MSVEDFGDTMAAVQGLLKKHDAFETDFAVHRDRCEQISHGGIDLADAKNHHADSILQRCQQLQVFKSFENLEFEFDNKNCVTQIDQVGQFICFGCQTQVQVDG